MEGEPSTSGSGTPAPGHSIVVRWNGKDITIVCDGSDTAADLKRRIEQQTSVQGKLIGLKRKGRPGQPTDDEPLRELEVKKLMLVGTEKAVIQQMEQLAQQAPEVENDFDVPEAVGELNVWEDPVFQEKLQRRIGKAPIIVLQPPRPGKRCLVLDIDYTLFDLGTPGEHAGEKARPYLHEFLESAYESYDLVVWSATSMKWVEGKLGQLGLLGHDRYKVTALMDGLSMVTVTTEKYGTFNCKPLQVLWAKFPEAYNEHNTIMIDDLGRNFVANPRQGLKIKPFKHARGTGGGDNELLRIKDYLILIAKLDTFDGLKHKNWEAYTRKHEKDLP